MKWRIGLNSDPSNTFGTVGTVHIDHPESNHSEKIAVHGDDRHEVAQSIVGHLNGDVWQPIETAPHGEDVLLYCPDRGCPTNRERIELGPYSTGKDFGRSSSISRHSWATHWMPLPPPPHTEEKE